MQRYCEHCRKYVEARRAPFSNQLICSICGTEFGVDYLTSGTIVSGFRIDVEIGRGSFGIVYKALQLNLERMVALKVLSDELSRDTDFVDNFFREARLAASLSHPNIVQAFDAGATPEGIYYFAMELIEGETLDSRIQRSGLIPQENAIDIALKIARALDYAWERQKLTHGDIKPENIIINSSGEAKLADLGLAKTANEESLGHLMVTPLYAPPEVVTGVAGYDAVKADIYSFGGTFYHMLSGTPPFNEDDPELVMQMHLHDVPVSLAERVNIHPDLSFITDRMLAKNPDERPRDWKEIIGFLEAIDLRPHQVSKSTRRPPLRNLGRLAFRRHKSVFFTAIGILGVVCICLMLGILYLSRAGSKDHGRDSGTRIGKASRDYEWNKLKTDIKFLSERKALELVSGFIGSHKEVPQEALQTLEALKKESEQADSRDRVGADFERELKDVIRRLKMIDLTTAPATELVVIQTRIINLFKLIGENKFLYSRISAEDKQFLDEKVKVLKGALQRHDNDVRKNWIIKLNNTKREYLEKVRNSERDSWVANEELDRFYMAAAAFDVLPGKNHTSATVNKLFGDISRKDLPAEYSRLLNFVRDSYKDDCNINIALAKLGSVLKGAELPEPNQYFGYRIASVDESSINLENRLDYGVLKKKVRLGQFKTKYKCDLLYRAIAVPAVSSKLTNAECNMVLRVFLDTHDNRFGDLIKNFYQLSEDNRNCWIQWSKVLKIAASEVDAINLYHQSNAAFANGKYVESVFFADKLQRDFGATELVKRYSHVLEQNHELSMAVSPELQATMLLAGYEKNQSSLDALSRLELAMTLKSRYGKLKSLPGTLVTWINAVAEAEMAAIKDPQHLSLAVCMASPAQFSPGVGWMLANRYLKENQVSATDRRLLNIFAYRDVGDWGRVGTIIANYKQGDKWFARGNKAVSWFSQAVYFGLLTLDRYGIVTSHNEALTALHELAVGAGGDSLAARCAFLKSQQELGLPLEENLIASFPFNSHVDAQSMRLAWLDLNNIISDQEPDRVEFSHKVEYYGKLFGDKEERQNAVKWMFFADRLVKGVCEPGEVEKLKSNPVRNDDLPVRVAISAAAYSFNSGKLGKEKLLLLNDLFGSVIGNGTIWSLDSEAAMTLKMASAESWPELLRTIRAFHGNTRIKNMSFYPQLTLLSLSGLQVSGKMDAKTLEETMPRFFDDCPIAGADFSSAHLLLSSSIPDKAIHKMFETGRTRQGFWIGMMLVMNNYYDYDRACRVWNVINGYRHNLSWEKRQLLDNMYKLLAELPE